MSDLFLKAQALEEAMIRDRRYLHSHAELGFDLPKTYDYVKKALENMGYQPQKCGKGGLVCLAGSGEKAFLLRADMDALPIREEADEGFASSNGCMHACGHDMHTAMLLGAARLLKQQERELRGCVKLMFQPAEEILQGSKDMVENGVLQNPAVEAGMMIHTMTGLPIKTGTVIVSSPGVSAPAVDMFEIMVKGRGAHGASPDLGIDPVNAAAHIIIALQVLQAREISAQSGGVLTIGAVQGGDAPNVITDSVTLRGSLRAYTAEEHAFLRQRLQEIAKLTAQAFRAEAEVIFTSGAPALANDANMVKAARRAVAAVLGEERVIRSQDMNKDSKSSGSEDFAYISQQIPTVMVALAAGDSREGYAHSLHHPQTRFDEAALKYGAAVYAGVAMAYFKEKDA